MSLNINVIIALELGFYLGSVVPQPGTDVVSAFNKKLAWQSSRIDRFLIPEIRVCSYLVDLNIFLSEGLRSYSES